MNPEFAAIGNAFVQHYYELFMGDRSQLLQLYQDDSLMSFEGAQVQGLEGIGEKLSQLSFQSVTFQFTEIDCQPRADGGIVVFVLGQIQTDEDPIKGFSQTFVLAPTAEGSWYIQNDIFRLNLHNFA
eukprot:TRINITY_DN18617_c0_g1_i1.p1 TRINITY_DN18617_c0_g1~~TRINITY_DN18617_c0_g1_i1.p1  ORF type:complete len:127 (+),score=19.30 TRINITY_DN18617_c0_g1_i1:195-575(+)